MSTDTHVLSSELLAVRYWRYREARAAGMTLVEAKLYSESDIDAEQLRRAVASGCPPELLARVVL